MTPNAQRIKKGLKPVNYDLFTFLIMNGNIPAVFIEGHRLSLVSCELIWRTATDSYPGEYVVLVTGYLDGLPELKFFKYDFISKILREGDGLNGTPTDEALRRLSAKLTFIEKGLKTPDEERKENDHESPYIHD